MREGFCVRVVGGVTVLKQLRRVLCRERILEILGRGCHNRILWPRVTGKLVLCFGCCAFSLNTLVNVKVTSVCAPKNFMIWVMW